MIKSKTYNMWFLLLLLSMYYIDFSLPFIFSIKPYMIIMVMIIVVYLVRNSGIVKLKLLSFDKLLLIFFTYVTIRNFFAFDIISSLKGTVAFLISIILYFVVRIVFSNINNEKVFKFIYISGIILVITIIIAGLFGYSEIYEPDRNVNRLRGFIQDPNFFALYITPFLLVSIYYLFKGKPTGFVLAIIMFMLTYSRSAFLSIILPILILVIMAFQGKKIKRKHVFYTFIVVLVITVGLLFTQRGQDVIEKVRYNILERVNETASSNQRKLLLNIGFNVFREYPIFGIGQLNSSRFLTNISNDYFHNAYLDMLVEFGIVGFILYSIMIGSLIFNKSNNTYSKIMKVIIITQMSILFFLSSINNETLFLAFALYFLLNEKNENFKIQKTY